MNITVGNKALALDEDGHLQKLADWNEVVADALAEQEGINLNEQHWEIINLLREFHTTFELLPSMRPLVNYVRIKLGDEKGRSIYLMQLFPPSPARVAARIAGLPRPENCL
jgi:tRNA 2-thiouridine synthesizing protein E